MTATQSRPGGLHAIPSCVLGEPAAVLDAGGLVLDHLTMPASDVASEQPKEDITRIHRVLAAGNNPAARREVAEVESPALPGSWLSAAKSRRDVPKAAKVAAGGVLAIVLGVFVLPGACGSPSTTKSSMIADTTVAPSDSLHKRRHLTDDDFRSGNGVAAPAPTASPAAPPSLSLEERQRLREQNPEDLRSAQTRRHPKRGRRVSQITASRDDAWEEEDMINFYKPEATEGSAAASRRGSKGVVLVPSAATVDVALPRDIVVRGGSTTVVALVGRGQLLPAGTKLLGRASADRDGFVTIRFRSLSLVDGTSVSVRAEAIDRASGSPTLIGSVSGGERADSVSESVGRDAAQRGIMTVVGGGFLGDTANTVASESNRSRRSSRRSPLVVTISSNTPVTVLFLHDVME